MLNTVSQMRPVILGVDRFNGFSDWAQILTPEGNKIDASSLVLFAQEFRAIGVKLMNLTPDNVSIGYIYIF